jgi:hypothetical protein
MVAGLETIPTQALQIWLRRDLGKLGLPVDQLQANERLMGASWLDPLNGWTDFSDLIEEENWPKPGPQALLYFCGPLLHVEPVYPDVDWPGRRRQAVKEDILTWWGEIKGLLPNASANFTDELYTGDRDGDPLDHQYLRANVQPNERYVLSKPGHLAYRRLAWHSGYRNLALAGDWIFTGLNISSFEGAVMSGALASHALTGWPPIDTITGYQFGRSTEDHMPDCSVPMIRTGEA